MIRDTNGNAGGRLDRWILVLSPSNLEGDDVSEAIEAELSLRQGAIYETRKMLPVSLARASALKSWKCRLQGWPWDLAKDYRKRGITDFSKWKAHDAFETLLQDLQSTWTPAPE